MKSHTTSKGPFKKTLTLDKLAIWQIVHLYKFHGFYYNPWINLNQAREDGLKDIAGYIWSNLRLNIIFIYWLSGTSINQIHLLLFGLKVGWCREISKESSQKLCGIRITKMWQILTVWVIRSPTDIRSLISFRLRHAILTSWKKTCRSHTHIRLYSFLWISLRHLSSLGVHQIYLLQRCFIAQLVIFYL